MRYWLRQAHWSPAPMRFPILLPGARCRSRRCEPGLLTGTFLSAETLLDTPLQMVRNIPALALIRLVIL
jgi:hypothetical protein